MRRLAPLAVIKHFDLFKPCRLRLVVCVKVLQRDQRSL
jgi:hypothetical protein